MPTVPASNLPYTGVPTAEPQVGVPSRFQTERATPEDFGAGIGTALSNLGGQIGRGADVLAENAIRLQEQHNQIVADDATNKYQDTETKLLYGDPNKLGDTGFYGLKGEDAQREFPKIRDALLQAREQGRSLLQNDRQKLAFDRETRNLQARTLAGVGHHYVSEMATYKAQVAAAGVENGMTRAAQALARGAEDEAEVAVGTAMRSFIEGAKARGQTDQAFIDNGLLKIRGDYVRQKVSVLVEKDPLAALTYFENNIDAIPHAEVIQLRNGLRSRAQAQQAEINAGNIPGVPSSQRQDKRGPHANLTGYSIGDLYNLAVEAGYEPGQKAAEAAAISMAESSGNPKAHNKGTKENPEDSHGLMQLNADAHGDLARTFDPHDNMRNSRVVSKEGTDWSPWSVYKNGAYRQFLPAAVSAAKSSRAQPMAQGISGGTSAPVQLVSDGADQMVEPPQKLPKLDFALPPLDSGELPDEQLPGMAQRLELIQKNVPADDVVARQLAVKAARRQLNQQYQDQQRQLRLHNEQMKAQATLVQDDYLKRMYPGAPNPPSIQEVLTDNKLREHPEVKRTLVSFMERENKTDPAALVSKQNTMQLFAKMNLPDGEAEKITTEEPFNKAYTGQEVTRADRDWLVTQFRTQRSAGGETIKNLKAQIITAVKPSILGPLAAADERIIEPDNALKLFNFIHAVDEKIDEYQKAGKNPVDLFNPKKTDFVGSDDFLRPFTAEMAQRMRQQARERTFVGPPAPGEVRAPPVSTGPDITKIPDGDLIQGLNSRKIDYNAGVKELERRGYGHRPAPPVR